MQKFGVWNGRQCNKCGRIEPEDQAYKDWMWKQVGNRGRAELPSFDQYLIMLGRAERTDKTYRYEAQVMLQTVLEAYHKSRKYKDGKRTKDTWLSAALIDVFRELKTVIPSFSFDYGFAFYQFRHAVIEWATKQKILVAVGDVDKAIPYAYSHRFGRGIKGHATWTVLQLSETIHNSEGHRLGEQHERKA